MASHDQCDIWNHSDEDDSSEDSSDEYVFKYAKPNIKRALRKLRRLEDVLGLDNPELAIKFGKELMKLYFAEEKETCYDFGAVTLILDRDLRLATETVSIESSLYSYGQMIGKYPEFGLNLFEIMVALGHIEKLNITCWRSIFDSLIEETFIEEFPIYQNGTGADGCQTESKFYRFCKTK